ncbi:hypothetical protein KW796_01350 [Candidatus Parcubacteria bacterium]|nr:hypothetical protein [Candidatus Parcubacteria bacterium]
MKIKFLTMGVLIFAPLFVSAAMSAPFEISGWIPYWRSATGTAEFLTHIDSFKEINPFGYTVKNDGTLNDEMKLSEAPWPELTALAHLKQIRVIPTVMWSNASAMDRVFRSTALRAAHIQQIVNAVYLNGFDGIDIDYEAKASETMPYFSLFLKELYKAMGKKWVMCTIEARTPPDSLRPDSSVPYIPAYANDYAVINQNCDRVRIMAYDQASVDRKLTTSVTGPYVPVADPKWVEKVLTLAEKSISKKKLMLGVATYGYEFRVTPLSSGYDYKHLWAFNPRYATELAASMGITPNRNIAGELSFIYRPDATSTEPTASVIATADSTLSQSFNIVWWSDAEAIRSKVELAKKHGIRGVSVFKIDGGADPNIWQVLK